MLAWNPIPGMNDARLVTLDAVFNFDSGATQFEYACVVLADMKIKNFGECYPVAGSRTKQVEDAVALCLTHALMITENSVVTENSAIDSEMC